MSTITRSRNRSHRPLTAKRRRLYLLLAAVVTLGIATALILYAFSGSIMFFYSPSDLVTKPVPQGRVIRLGGLVADGSVHKVPGTAEVRFTVTDHKHSVPVEYRGILPDLFREGQGVVTEGSFLPGGVFHATQVLAKHDETYMPKNVADALKRAGEWKRGGTGGAPAGTPEGGGGG